MGWLVIFICTPLISLTVIKVISRKKTSKHQKQAQVIHIDFQKEKIKKDEAA